MFCACAIIENNQEEGDPTLLLQKVVAPKINNEGRNKIGSQYECKTLFPGKEAHGGHVKDD
jgi:hypothetical protein